MPKHSKTKQDKPQREKRAKPQGYHSGY